MTILLLPRGAPGPDGMPTKMAVDDFIVEYGSDAFRNLVADQMGSRIKPAQSVEEFQKDLAARRLQSVGTHGVVFFDHSATGSGKSIADIPAMAMAGTSLTVLATHKNCAEKEQELQSRGMDAVAYPQLNKDTCENYAVASQAINSGLSPSVCVCPSCQFRPMCPYWHGMQSADAAPHRIATHHRGALYFHGLAEGRKYIAIHEDPVGLLRPAVELSAQLREVDEVATKALDNCLRFKLPIAPYFHAMREAVRFLESQLSEAEKSGQILPPESLCKATDVDRILFQAMGELDVWPNGDAVRVAKGIASGEVADVCVRVDRILTKGGLPEFRRSIVAFWQTPLPLHATIWMSDATAKFEEICEVCPFPVIDCTPDGKIENFHAVEQIPLDIKKSTSPKVVVRIMRAVLAHYPRARRIGVICDKKHIPVLSGTAKAGPVLDAAHRSRIVKIEHFRSGEGRGSNLWTEQCDLLIVAGTPRVPPPAIKMRLMQVRRPEAAGRPDEWVAWEADWWSGMTLSGQRRTVRTFAYRDHDWHQAHTALVKAELQQCLGRARANRRDGIPAVVISNEDLGLKLIDADPYVATDVDVKVLEAMWELSDLSSICSYHRNQSDELSDLSSKGASQASDRTTLLNIYILETRSVSSRNVASKTGWCEKVVRRLLSRLERAGLVGRIGQRGGWHLTETGVAQLSALIPVAAAVEETAPLEDSPSSNPRSPLEDGSDF